jgi:tetrahedral aminopeptidase
MNDDQFAFLQQLVESTGPAGYETETQSIWRDRVRANADTVETDLLGSSIAVLNADSSLRVMLDAHIDEIGFQIKYIDDNGFLYFSTIGGFDGSTLPGNRVRIAGKNGPVLGVIGRKPIHLMESEERKKAPELKKLWIDIGASARSDAEALVSIGDAGGRAHGLERMHANLAVANSFDDRVGGYIIAEAFRNLARAKTTTGVFAASSTQEEVGLRGAHAAAYRIDTTIGIAVEVTHATDHPHASKTEQGDIRVGAGPVIDVGANTNPRVFRQLVAAAEAEDLPYQIEANPSGTGTDQNPMQMTRSGMATGLISVPLRYMHTSSEVISLDDVDNAVALLTRFVTELDASLDLTP